MNFSEPTIGVRSAPETVVSGISHSDFMDADELHAEQCLIEVSIVVDDNPTESVTVLLSQEDYTNILNGQSIIKKFTRMANLIT